MNHPVLIKAWWFFIENQYQPWKKAAFVHQAYHVNDIAEQTSNCNFIATSDSTFELYNRK